MQTMIDFSIVKGISIDLDETLWPILPTIIRAEALTQQWIVTHAPAVALRYDTKGLRALRDQLQLEDPIRKVDLLKARRDTLLHAFEACGEPKSKALEALEVFVEARQIVDLFDDANPFLELIHKRYPVVALSNGFADIHAVGIGHFFKASVSAHIVGIAKPDVRIFTMAADALGCTNEQVLHIGDDAELDVQGALAAGMQAYHVRRPGNGLDLLTQLIK
jgi:FMN hydrolase / 5-amino-6-(5-phospho-D-ribitylamino)uracil phosphatase